MWNTWDRQPDLLEPHSIGLCWTRLCSVLTNWAKATAVWKQINFSGSINGTLGWTGLFSDLNSYLFYKTTDVGSMSVLVDQGVLKLFLLRQCGWHSCYDLCRLPTGFDPLFCIDLKFLWPFCPKLNQLFILPGKVNEYQHLRDLTCKGFVFDPGGDKKTKQLSKACNIQAHQWL